MAPVKMKGYNDIVYITKCHSIKCVVKTCMPLHFIITMNETRATTRIVIVLFKKLSLVIKLINKKFRVNNKNAVLSPVRRIIVANSKLNRLKYKIFNNFLSKNK